MQLYCRKQLQPSLPFCWWVSHSWFIRMWLTCPVSESYIGVKIMSVQNVFFQHSFCLTDDLQFSQPATCQWCWAVLTCYFIRLKWVQRLTRAIKRLYVIKLLVLDIVICKTYKTLKLYSLSNNFRPNVKLSPFRGIWVQCSEGAKLFPSKCKVKYFNLPHALFLTHFIQIYAFTDSIRS